jgi:hypothetical protein
MKMSCEGWWDRDGSPEVNVGQFVRQVQFLSTVWHVTVYGGNWSERNIIRVIRGEDDVGGGVGRAPEWGQDQRLSHCS